MECFLEPSREVVSDVFENLLEVFFVCEYIPSTNRVGLITTNDVSNACHREEIILQILHHLNGEAYDRDRPEGY